MKYLRLAFWKNCSEGALPNEKGGLDLPGLNIGTTPMGNDVVSDGFPRPSYFGQRNKAVPEWNDIIVSKRKASTMLFISYTPMSLGLTAVGLQAPSVYSHNNIAVPKLGTPQYPPYISLTLTTLINSYLII